jgi:cytochrome oxidase Cu insertion factor (SCO1/SenC/PrrC family)
VQEASTPPPLIFLAGLPLLAALLLAIAVTAPRPAVKLTPKVGDPAPAFALRDQHGKRVSLADAAGTKVVLVFYRGYW